MIVSHLSGAMPAALPRNEEERLAVLRGLCILDTPSESAFDELTAMAVKIFSVPVALISLVDEHRQFFKSVHGLDLRETSRDLSFCAHSLLTEGPTLVPDARLDPRFATNPFVTGDPNIRLYASAPLTTKDGTRLGSFCIISPQVRNLTPGEVELLEHLANAASYLIDQRTTALQLEAAQKQIDIVGERYRLATRATSDGIWDWDCRVGDIYLSPRCSAMFGFEEKEHTLRLRDCLRHIHAEDRRRMLDQLNQAVEQHRNFSCEYRHLRADGEWRWMECSGLVLTDAKGAPQRKVGALRDITRIRALDPLTGLYNRASFIERVQGCMDQQGRQCGPYAVLYVDVDHFKRINDSLGHMEGDVVLEEIARRISQGLSSHSNSCAARLSSDEFAIFLNEYGEEANVFSYVEQLREALQVPVYSGEQTLILTASIGIALSDPTVKDARTVLENADLAMYQAKNAGRATSVFFLPDMRESAARKVQLELELRTAIEEGQIHLHYQPKVVLRTGKVVGFEALVRWKHPVRGMVSPADFIPVAEETGLIRELGLNVLSQAIQQSARWRQEGILTEEMNVAVNISGKQIGDSNLIGFIRDQLQAAGLPPHNLRLEVTESLLLNSDETTGEFFREIKALGIGIDMDDFGTGYSSLSYLHRFPFDALKVDRSFVQRIDQTEESLSLPRSIVALGKALGMRVLAEGIENQQQLAQLIRMDCGYGQGYLFSRPVPPEDVADLIKKLNGKIRTELMAS